VERGLRGKEECHGVSGFDVDNVLLAPQTGSSCNGILTIADLMRRCAVKIWDFLTTPIGPHDPNRMKWGTPFLVELRLFRDWGPRLSERWGC
jgi:hypothetical protein